MENFKLFNPLSVSSKFSICGCPIRVDTYRGGCGFGCVYCFANSRTVYCSTQGLQIANITQVERKLNKIIEKKQVNPQNFLDTLISKGYDWHLGGMSDPLQPVEEKLHITKKLIDVTNKYRIHILVSTKSSNLYECDFRPDLHSFQFSVSNVNNRKDIEPNVPDIEERLSLFKKLKQEGFKVGIRIQPFIPGIATTDIVKMFSGADHFTLEGIKLVPQNRDHIEKCKEIFGLQSSDFTQMGLLNLRPKIRLQMYQPFVELFEKNRISYSIADNDLHYLGNNDCCCGDALVSKATTFSNTYLLHHYGCHYAKENVDFEVKQCGVADCKCNNLFTSNRQEGCKTVQEFYDKRFYRKSSTFSPEFQYEKES